MINDLRTESRQRLASRPRPELTLVEVPSALGRRPSGVQDAPDALREAIDYHADFVHSTTSRRGEGCLDRPRSRDRTWANRAE